MLRRYLMEQLKPWRREISLVVSLTVIQIGLLWGFHRLTYVAPQEAVQTPPQYTLHLTTLTQELEECRSERFFQLLNDNNKKD